MSRLALAAGAAALSLSLVTPTPAGAAAHKPESLGQAGSDTTYFMMRPIAAQYVKSKYNTNHDKITEIPPINCATADTNCTGANNPFPASVTVPGDFVHPAKTWNSKTPTATPPDGSSAGISALEADTTGQISFARSSRGPNPGETSTMNFWAYALGAVDFVDWPGTAAPAAGLTQADLIGIYTCDPSTGNPFITNWSQVGGANAPIVRYAPQAGSGTLSFFQTKWLNGASVDANCSPSNLAIRLEEHDALGVTSASKPDAIYLFDWARYNAQKKGFEHNLTNGSVLGKAGVSTPVLPTSANVNETASRFYGTRYVYNVVRKNTHPKKATDQFLDATRLIGVRPSGQGGAQYICAGRAKALIIKAGFVPLPKFGTGGVGLPSSYCRLNPKPL